MYKSTLKISLVALLSLLIFSCKNIEDTDTLFFTKTSVGIDADNTPPGISIGYERAEGFSGPTYETGAIPPVVGVFRSNSDVGFAPISGIVNIFNPKIKQLYATGEAATTVVQEDYNKNDGKSDGKNILKGNKKRMIFGSNTAFGIKISTMPNGASFILGHRRKEASLIPIVELGEGEANKDEEKYYGSVLASVDNTLKQRSGKDSTFTAIQYFATGEAAEHLAERKDIRKIFGKEFVSAVQSSFGSAEQNELIWRSLSCAVYIEKHEHWESIVKSAYALKLFLKSSDDGQEVGALEKDFKVSLKNLNDKQSSENAVKLLRTYSAYLKAGRRLDMEYTISSLIKHKDLVCCFARTRNSKSKDSDQKCINDYNKEI